MITRAQAEALLTLAESLEACERLGVEVSQEWETGGLEIGPYSINDCLSAQAIREAIPKLLERKD